MSDTEILNEMMNLEHEIDKILVWTGNKDHSVRSVSKI